MVPETTGSLTERLRRDLVNGRYQRGLPIEISKLELTYGVSAIPIREALISLAAEGLVEHLPRRGFRTASLDFLHVKNTLDYLELMLIDAAYYLAGNDLRREKVLASLKKHFPLTADQMLSTTAYDVANRLCRVFQETGRQPHTAYLTRSAYGVADIIWYETRHGGEIETFHRSVRNYFGAIIKRLPELSEAGVKQSFDRMRERLSDTLNAMC
ncbi:GntR family transcriptional regulator [Pelagibacterium halotolerans]|uniref:GntR family transcriptional regulator n=1 Tax=Pelagibacterium halotolerans TaxID=531813 RepID=UPI00384F8EED